MTGPTTNVDALLAKALDELRTLPEAQIRQVLEAARVALARPPTVHAAIDTLSGWRYEDKDFQDADGRPRGDCRFAAFVRLYFGPEYAPHAEKLYKFRCRSLHNFSPAYFTVEHGRPSEHLQPSRGGDTVLDDASFFAATRSAAEKYFAELEASPELQTKMLARLHADRGGAIFITR